MKNIGKSMEIYKLKKVGKAMKKSEKCLKNYEKLRKAEKATRLEMGT